MSQNDTEIRNLPKKERREFLKQQKGQTKQAERRNFLMVRLGLVFVGFLAVGALAFLWFLAKPTSQPASSSSGMDRIGNLKLGDQAPDFSLPSATGKTVALKDYSGKNVLLYFQEGLMCQPCWKQIGTLEKDLDSFEQIQTEIVTVGVDSASDWRPVLAAEGINKIPILVDADREMSRAYGVLSLPSQMHSDRPGHTFILVDKEGKIAWMADYPTMRVSNEEVLNSIKKSLDKKS